MFGAARRRPRPGHLRPDLRRPFLRVRPLAGRLALRLLLVVLLVLVLVLLDVLRLAAILSYPLPILLSLLSVLWFVGRYQMVSPGDR